MQSRTAIYEQDDLTGSINMLLKDLDGLADSNVCVSDFLCTCCGLCEVKYNYVCHL